MADELGSGVRNVFKYTGIFSNGGNPQFIEDDVFKLIIPVTAQVTAHATAQADREKEIVSFCKIPRTRDAIQKHTNINHREYFRKEVLNPLLQKGLLKMTLPEKPNSPRQKYYSGDKEVRDG